MKSWTGVTGDKSIIRDADDPRLGKRYNAYIPASENI